MVKIRNALNVLIKHNIVNKTGPVYYYLQNCIKTKKIDLYKYFLLSPMSVKNSIYFDSSYKFYNSCLLDNMVKYMKNIAYKNHYTGDYMLRFINNADNHHYYIKYYYSKIYSEWINLEYEHVLSDNVKTLLYENLSRVEEY